MLKSVYLPKQRVKKKQKEFRLSFNYYLLSQAVIIVGIYLGGENMRRLLLLMIALFAFVATGACVTPTYHPPAYHPPAYHPPAHTNTYHAPARNNTYHAPARNNTYHAPRNNTPRNNTPRNNTPRNNTHNNTSHNNHNAQRDQRNAQRNQHNANRNTERARNNARKNQVKARRNAYKQRRNDHRAARGAYHNGRFNDRYFGSHFGREHAVVFGTPGLWVGRPFYSPFWWGGVQWGFGPGIFWPDAWGMGLGVYIDYIPGIGFVLVNPAFPDTTLPLTADVDAQPVDDSNQVTDQPADQQ